MLRRVLPLLLAPLLPLSCSSEAKPPAKVASAPPAQSSFMPAPAAPSSATSSRPQRALVDTPIRPVVDELFGERLEDPYRWLEDGDAKEVRAWTDAENARTRRVLDGPRRDAIRARLDELLSIGYVSGAAVRTGQAGVRRYFHYRRDGKMNQAVLFVREGREGKDRALVDPAQVSGGEATAAIDWSYPSRDGALVAFGISTSGDEESTLRVRDVAAGKDLADRISRTRGASLAWARDGKGFWYTREPDPKSVPKGEEHYHKKVFFHRMGDDPAKDALVFPEVERDLTHIPTVQLSPSGRWLVVRVHQGWAKSSVFARDLTKKGADWITIVDGPDALFDPLPHRDAEGREAIWLRTNDGAPNFKIVRVDPEHPERARWVEVVAASPTTVIRDFELVSSSLLVGRLERASTKVARYDLKGNKLEDLPIGALSTASVPTGEPDGDELVWEEQSFLAPPTLFARALAPKKPGTAPAVLASVTSTIDPSRFEVEQIEATSKDGTVVTAFVVHPKGLARDGKAPLLLGGYGGFNIPQLPSFNRTVFALLERGGVYVLSNLRGGSEYGEAWHRAGMLESKQHVFDDQIAVAERVIALGYTSKERLAILGGSNGGLLVGALVTQRPELFRAAICNVPLLDMLRYDRFLIAKLWVPEYGSAADPRQLAWLRAYSPYQHVQDGVAYPAVLLLTADSDARVDPLHARKMAARLQWATSSDRPILLRVETKAGHGAGKPRSKQLEELADQYAFLFRELAIEP